MARKFMSTLNCVILFVFIGKAERPTCWTVIPKGRRSRVLFIFELEMYTFTQGESPQQIVTGMIHIHQLLPYFYLESRLESN